MDNFNLSFDEDLLQRKSFVTNLMNVIYSWNETEHENMSMSIAINAKWGAGKSYLLNMWRNALQKCEFNFGDSGIVYYDAWKSDGYKDAFIPFAHELINLEVGSNNYELNNILKDNGKKLLKHCGVALLKRQAEKFVGGEFIDEVIKTIDDIGDSKIESIFSHYNSYLSTQKEFSDSLQSLIPDKGKLFVFIDELDRCRPEFAIETLEIIKHYCNIPNIVFIYAIDLQQISYSIQSLYGQGMDSSGYLRRFFDYSINLPTINIDKYIASKILDLSTVLNKRKDLDITEIKNIFLKLDLSLRDINKNMDNIMIFCSFYKEKILKYKDLSNLNTYIYFITLKNKYPEEYKIILDDYGYILVGNTPQNWPVIDNKIFLGMKVSELIRSGQTGELSNTDKGSEFVSKFGFPGLKSNKGSFTNHIKLVLELF